MRLKKVVGVDETAKLDRATNNLPPAIHPGRRGRASFPATPPPLPLTIYLDSRPGLRKDGCAWQFRSKIGQIRVRRLRIRCRLWPPCRRAWCIMEARVQRQRLLRHTYSTCTEADGAGCTRPEQSPHWCLGSLPWGSTCKRRGRWKHASYDLWPWLCASPWTAEQGRAGQAGRLVRAAVVKQRPPTPAPASRRLLVAQEPCTACEWPVCRQWSHFLSMAKLSGAAHGSVWSRVALSAGKSSRTCLLPVQLKHL
jgi:hypothetical protein